MRTISSNKNELENIYNTKHPEIKNLRAWILFFDRSPHMNNMKTHINGVIRKANNLDIIKNIELDFVILKSKQADKNYLFYAQDHIQI